MEMLGIAMVTIIAFAAVLLPLLRRGGGGVADEREFDTGVALHADPAVADAGAALRDDVPAAAAPDGGRGGHEARADIDGERIEREVLRYREALRAGTLCARCGAANPPGSVYCAECGKRLPLADAKEFA